VADVSTETGDELLDSQIAYYRAHAPKYDDWWFHRGHHDLGDSYRESWNSQIERLRSALLEFAPLGDVLEFAGGTGNWTRELAPLAHSVQVLDASPEAVAIANEKVSGNISWTIGNIFEHRPERRYDTVFFGFWLSHVPDSRFDTFWALVADCLKRDGRVFFIDNAHPEVAKHLAPQFFNAGRWTQDETTLGGIDSITDLSTGVAVRRAADGGSYQLVKIWRRPEELETRLGELGWTVTVRSTDWAFIYGSGRRDG
jgi:demethylmenaquinone methyltransferase/2-methoxy-6-polyprenyl-1,4-benzoquinol methylase